jgi:uncharacterized protein YgiM (DUF1202 family)
LTLRWANPGKRGLGLVLVITFLLVSAGSGAAATRARVNSPDGVNLRDAPSASGAVIAVLAYGTFVDVLSAPLDDGWYQVNAGGLLGFAKGAYLDIPTTPAARGDATVASPDGVRLRSSPSTASPILATLPAGRLVQLQSDPTDDGWYQVQTQEGSGWVDGAFLQFGVPAGSVSTGPIMIRWYGHEFDGGVLACGGRFSADDPTTAASTSYPCGTVLQICANVRCVNVIVRDRGQMGPGAIDLSAAAFSRLAPLETGVLTGTVQITFDLPPTPVPSPGPAPVPTPSNP